MLSHTEKTDADVLVALHISRNAAQVAAYGRTPTVDTEQKTLLAREFFKRHLGVGQCQNLT